MRSPVGLIDAILILNRLPAREIRLGDKTINTTIDLVTHPALHMRAFKTISVPVKIKQYYVSIPGDF